LTERDEDGTIAWSYLPSDMIAVSLVARALGLPLMTGDEDGPEHEH
jgi:hypothetical protein